MPPRGPQEAPKRPPRGPKRPPRGPKRPPRGPQEAPKRPQEAPRGLQNGAKIEEKSIENVIHLGIYFWKDFGGLLVLLRPLKSCKVL